MSRADEYISEKYWTEWWPGSIPVAMEVQTTGEKGEIVSSGAVTPFSWSVAKFGRAPALIRGSITVQSAPSRPRRTTRFPFRVASPSGAPSVEAGFAEGAEIARASMSRLTSLGLERTNIVIQNAAAAVS